MTTAEMKLDIFRRIDKLQNAELEKVFQAVLSLLTPPEKYTLSRPEKTAVNEALKYSAEKEPFTTESVLKEAKNRYPKLKFK